LGAMSGVDPGTAAGVFVGGELALFLALIVADVLGTGQVRMVSTVDSSSNRTRVKVSAPQGSSIFPSEYEGDAENVGPGR
jgi:hypothetical protein